MTLKEIRAATGLSQAKFAVKFRIPRQNIELWETGKRTPPSYVIELLEYKVLTENRIEELEKVIDVKEREIKDLLYNRA